MKKNLLLSTLQYIQCFTKEHRIGIKIEKYDNNVYRFIATNGSMLSYIDIDIRIFLLEFFFWSIYFVIR